MDSADSGDWASYSRKDGSIVPRKEAFSKNMEVVGYHDLHGKPGFQMAMQEVDGRYYLYLAHFRHSGWAILDVTDPSRPEYLRFVPGPDKAGQVTLKLQVAGGLMVTALQQAFPFLHGTSWEDPYEEGVYIWDVKDPANPKWLSHWQTGGGLGVHRFFYDGGRYVHLAASCRGFKGFLYRVLDIADPTKPLEVGRWWHPEQWTAGFVEPKEPPAGDVLLNLLDGPNMHGPAYPKGELAYLSYGGAGMVILDISDITLPRLVGQLRHNPPLSGKLSGARCHTVVPLSQRPYAVMTSEGERYPVFTKEFIGGVAQPLNFIGMVDVSNPSDPTLISIFPYPEIPEGWPYENFNEIPGVGAGPFGPHNLHEPHYHPALEDRNDRIYCCYFHAGLRIYDTSDPFVPREIAHYIPPDPESWAFNNAAGDLFPGPNIATTEDVIVDNRGYIYMDTLHQGLYVLRCTV
jgi:hypothetical protein